MILQRCEYNLIGRERVLIVLWSVEIYEVRHRLTGSKSKTEPKDKYRWPIDHKPYTNKSSTVRVRERWGVFMIEMASAVFRLERLQRMSRTRKRYTFVKSTEHFDKLKQTFLNIFSFHGDFICLMFFGPKYSRRSCRSFYNTMRFTRCVHTNDKWEIKIRKRVVKLL